MTFETRARGAVLDIHRAVEVMEMTTSTKEPRRIERFDQFRDRKQRNRRIGALVVVGAIVVAAIVAYVTNVPGDDRPVVPLAPTPLTGRIVYQVYEGGAGAYVYTMDPPGAPGADLGVFTDPGSHWSPDGTKILVASLAGPPETAKPVRPATVAADGSDFQLLDGVKDPSLNLACAVFSPDGSRIACEGYSDFDDAIYTVRASDGGDLQRVTRTAGYPTDYSPDGDQIVFLGEDADEGVPSDDVGTLFVVGTDGTGLHEISEPNSVMALSHAGWSPDGTWIVFVHPDGFLMLVHPDGSGLHRIPHDDAVGAAATGGASWSPDGTWIAFSAGTGDVPNPDLWVIRPDGTELQQITDTPDVSEFQPDWIQ